MGAWGWWHHARPETPWTCQHVRPQQARAESASWAKDRTHPQQCHDCSCSSMQARLGPSHVAFVCLMHVRHCALCLACLCAIMGSAVLPTLHLTLHTLHMFACSAQGSRSRCSRQLPVSSQAAARGCRCRCAPSSQALRAPGLNLHWCLLLGIESRSGCMLVHAVLPSQRFSTLGASHGAPQHPLNRCFPFTCTPHRGSAHMRAAHYAQLHMHMGCRIAHALLTCVLASARPHSRVQC